MLRKGLLALSLLMVVGSIHGQTPVPFGSRGDNDMRYATTLYESLYFTFFGDVGLAPAVADTVEPFLGVRRYELKETTWYSIGTVSYEFRKQLFDVAPEISVSVAMPLTLGLSMFRDPNAFGTVRVPLFADMNFGYLANSSSMDSKFGFHVGVGYQLTAGPLVLVDDGYNAKRIWTQPVIRMGFRIKAKSGKDTFILFNYGHGRVAEEFIAGQMRSARELYQYNLSFGFPIWR